MAVYVHIRNFEQLGLPILVLAHLANDAQERVDDSHDPVGLMVVLVPVFVGREQDVLHVDPQHAIVGFAKVGLDFGRDVIFFWHRA